MMKKLTLALLALCFSRMVSAQYDTLTIQQIQFVSQPDLASCIDTSSYHGDTVYVYGTVMMDGGLSQAAGGRNVWIQSGTGPFSGIDVFTTGVPIPVPGTDVLDLAAGDSVLILGKVDQFRGESEIVPLEIEVLDFGKSVNYTTINVGDLNDDQKVNIPQTGEQWEGTYVEITNVTVVSVDNFTASGVERVSFDVEDANGNLVTISDRFLAQRKPSAGGTFVPPVVGSKYNYIRGVVLHGFPNGCLPTNSGTLLGYEIDPFEPSDYDLGVSAPLISAVTRNPITPKPTDDANISAAIVDPDGNVVSASLFYAVGESNNSYLEIPMTATGSTFSATIPNTAYSEGDIVKYYLSATDDSAFTTTSPVANTAAPYFFVVRENGTTIYDVQYTIYTSGRSGYDGLEVTVEGIVTATADPKDLGYVYIQQEGKTTWGALALTGNATLATLKRGDKVRARGVVQDVTNFGLTRLGNILEVTVLSQGNALPDPVEIDPDDFTTYDVATTEPYECMLVKLKNPAGGNIYVVDVNADAPSNFAEYRVGTNPFDPLAGCRVLAGRVTTSAFSSLSFSYINDSTWITNSGAIDPNLPICIVSSGDTLTSLTGIMYYSFSAMKILPRNNADAEGFSGANCPGGITGIADDLAGSVIRAYPVPASENVIVEYEFPKMVTGTVYLFDIMGRVVGSSKIQGLTGTTTLPVSNLTAGNYFLSVEVEGVLIERKKIAVIH
ncbi:MAG: T9SS type A sorting domain-containing protein [Bacteroidia bacterium]|nr:T9SS type A sorting domain-containing protein [Bacteroidia bacterium]